MTTYPQVVLFGSIYGEWREQHIIPVLEELGVTYYNPISPDGWWNKALGDQEAEFMAHCETIVMVINKTSPSFSSLAETGWAALGAAVRKQHFILQVDLDYTLELPATLQAAAADQQFDRQLKHWTVSSRYLVVKHAQQFKLDTLYLVDDIAGVSAQLRRIYGK